MRRGHGFFGTAGVWLVWIVVGGPALAGLAPPLEAQAPSNVDRGSSEAIFGALHGSWIGDGTLLQRPARFRMTWTRAGDRFARLSFQNAFVDTDGGETVVLSAEAVYRWTDGSALGVWIDTRPQRIRLDAVVTDSSLVTTWTADAERGRTEYVIRSATEIVVRDEVEVDGAFRPFGEAVYRRDPDSEPPGVG